MLWEYYKFEKFMLSSLRRRKFDIEKKIRDQKFLLLQYNVRQKIDKENQIIIKDHFLL